jgi:hypothetical protein
MSVLARDLDAYKRALEMYQRKVAKHNTKASQYEQSMVRDANGNSLIRDANGSIKAADSATGNLVDAKLPEGFDPAKYGATEIPDAPGYFSLRQNPTGKRTEEVSGAYRQVDPDTGVESYYTPIAESSDSGTGRSRVEGQGWQVKRENSTPYSGPYSAENQSPTTYDLTREVPEYLDRPDPFTEQFKQKAPSYTKAMAAAASRPSYAQQEAGLIGEVMKGRGVR